MNTLFSRVRWAAPTIAAALFLLPGCLIDRHVDLEAFVCDQQVECISGFVCDLERRLCVRQTEQGPPPSGCIPGATLPCSCENGSLGAKTCDDDGLFSACDCQPEITGPPGASFSCSGDIPEFLGVCKDAPALCVKPAGQEPDWEPDHSKVEGYAVDDAHCDGLDSDCDGDVDEGFVVLDTVCGAEDCQHAGQKSCTNGELVDDCVPPTEAECQLPAECGNGRREGEEQCDDGDDSNENACVAGCRDAICGDGFVREGVEECDDQNEDENDGCLTSCRLASCGDGYILADEEACDDANESPFDGCHQCQILAGFTCAGQPSQCVELLEGFVLIEAGRFAMGCHPEDQQCADPERPQHEVSISSNFYLQATEVTQEQWDSLMPHNPSGRSDCPRCPVENVTQSDTLPFCNALSDAHGLSLCYTNLDEACSGGPPGARGEDREAGRTYSCVVGHPVEIDWDCTGYRLPTEAEWEYAARANTLTPYPDGVEEDQEALAEYAWFRDFGAGPPDLPDETQPVGGLEPNAWGLYDVLGNVAEWVWGGFSQYPEAQGDGVETDPLGECPNADDLTCFQRRPLRGCSFDAFAEHCRFSARRSIGNGQTAPDIGFRIVRSLGP